MCMWDDDGESYQMADRQMRRARKEHRCTECNRTIAIGERHEVMKGLYDGHWDTHRVCAQCIEARRWLAEVCEGWLYTTIEEDLREHVDGHERALRTRPLTRLARWMHHDWRDRAGNLRDPEAVKAVTDEAIAAYERQLEAGLV